MKKSIVRITTTDTGKTYEFPGDNPQLFEASITISPIGQDGESLGSSYGYLRINKLIYIELDTILKAGLKPYQYKKKESDPEPEETAEDLIIRLLEHVGYYPCEHE